MASAEAMGFQSTVPLSHVRGEAFSYGRKE
jgi:hypothetical protein